ncbi:hypothetical protein KAR10_07620, partial [bacterium]|nr:hypothetical protein [bacterium]
MTRKKKKNLRKKDESRNSGLLQPLYIAGFLFLLGLLCCARDFMFQGLFIIVMSLLFYGVTLFGSREMKHNKKTIGLLFAGVVIGILLIFQIKDFQRFYISFHAIAISLWLLFAAITLWLSLNTLYPNHKYYFTWGFIIISGYILLLGRLGFPPGLFVIIGGFAIATLVATYLILWKSAWFNSLAKPSRFAVYLLILVLLFIFLNNAWVSEDAYITFRAVDNFVNGYGLRWNISERVQVYTSPLWFLCVSLIYCFTHEPYYTSIAISWVSVFITGFLILRYFTQAGMKMIAAVMLLTFSKAFMDYTSSGLENPFIYLFITLFYVVYLRGPKDDRTFLWLNLIAALGVLTRMDCLLFFAPALGYRFWHPKAGSSRRYYIKAAGLGWLPFIAWELFSLFYYGFLFPNTAYAKLNTGIPRWELIPHGIDYFLNSLVMDPITLCIILLTPILICIFKKKNHWPLMLGIALYGLYLILIGGDYMSGR